MSGFGKWLHDKRKAAGLTQGQLAQKAGISTSYVSTLERSERHHLTDAPPQPTTEVVDSIAKALNVAMDDARLAAGYAASGNSPLLDIGFDAAVKLGTDVSPEERQEIAEELALAYEVIMARRKRRNTEN